MQKKSGNSILPIDMTYFKPRGANEVIPSIKGLQQEWLDACKGNPKTSCNCEEDGLMTEQMLLVLVAYCAGKKIEHDGASRRITNAAAANEWLRHTFRPRWTLNG